MPIDDDDEDPILVSELDKSELKQLTTTLKRLAKSADAADNLACRPNPQWSVQVFEAQAFCADIVNRYGLSSKEQMFVDAIHRCCCTVLKRQRVIVLHEEEPKLPKPELWVEGTLLDNMNLNDMRRLCVDYELKNANEKARPINLGSSRAACIAAMIAYRAAQGHYS